jgi:GT2 family glycosyltransferase
LTVLPHAASSVRRDAAPEISVIIVSWNAFRVLSECLESLSEGISRSYEVIVVDNASTDGSPDIVDKRFPWVTLIQTGKNLGFAKANNIGIQRSRGKYVALVNSDVKVLPGCLDNLAEFLDQNADSGMVGPRMMYADGRLQSSCRRFPSLWNNACEAIGLNKIFPRARFFAGEHMFYFSCDQTCEVEVLVGCFILARRTAIDEFGLLDEAFFMYGEDLDWCRRCMLAGWKVMFYPSAEAIHYGGGSSANDPVRFDIAQQRARLQLWAKHHSRASWFAVAALMIAQRCIRIVAAYLAISINRRAGSSPSEAVRRRHVACLRALCAELGLNLGFTNVVPRKTLQ